MAQLLEAMRRSNIRHCKTTNYPMWVSDTGSIVKRSVEPKVSALHESSISFS
jgi:hypothetical protein